MLWVRSGLLALAPFAVATAMASSVAPVGRCLPSILVQSAASEHSGRHHRRHGGYAGASRAPPSGIHVPAIDGDVLPGDEIAFGAGKENQGAEQIFRLFVALYG